MAKAKGRGKSKNQRMMMRVQRWEGTSGRKKVAKERVEEIPT